jgi:Flp pilus assembly protein TadD
LLPLPSQAADGPDAYVERALRYYQEQLYEQARGQLETSLKLHADHPGSHALLGLVLDMQGDRNNARFHLEKSLELIPHNSTYRLNLVRFYLKSNLIANAEKTLEPLVTTSPSAEVYQMLGYIRLKQRQEGEAALLLEKAVNLERTSFDNWYYLGFAYHSLGKFDAAISSYSEVLKREPRHFRANLQLGKIYLTLGDRSQALRYLMLAREIRASYPSVHRYLSQAQLAVGQTEAAKESAERAVQLKSDDPRSHYQLGRVLQQLGRSEEANDQYGIADRQQAAFQSASPDELEESP